METAQGVCVFYIKFLKPKKQEHYDHSPPISQKIQVNKQDMLGTAAELGNDLSVKKYTGFLQMDRTVFAAKHTYIHQLCVDTTCRLEDLLIAMDNRDEGRVSKVSPCYRHDLLV